MAINMALLTVSYQTNLILFIVGLKAWLIQVIGVIYLDS